MNDQRHQPGYKGHPQRLSMSPNDKENKFQKTTSRKKYAEIILVVGKQLPEIKLKDVKFLCSDKLSCRRVLETAKNATDVLKDMSVYGTLDETNLGLVAELLQRIGMAKTKMEVFKGTSVIWPTRRRQSFFDPFRCLLYDINRELSIDETLADLINYFVLRDVLTLGQADRIDDFLDIFTLLEEQLAVTAADISLLKDISEFIFKNQKIKKFILKYEILRDNEVSENYPPTELVTPLMLSNSTSNHDDDCSFPRRELTSGPGQLREKAIYRYTC